MTCENVTGFTGSVEVTPRASKELKKEKLFEIMNGIDGIWRSLAMTWTISISTGGCTPYRPVDLYMTNLLKCFVN